MCLDRWGVFEPLSVIPHTMTMTCCREKKSNKNRFFKNEENGKIFSLYSLTKLNSANSLSSFLLPQLRYLAAYFVKGLASSWCITANILQMLYTRRIDE